MDDTRDHRWGMTDFHSQASADYQTECGQFGQHIDDGVV